MLSGCYQLMWSHSHLMWFLAPRYSQLIWSQKPDVIGSCDLCNRAATPISRNRCPPPWRARCRDQAAPADMKLLKRPVPPPGPITATTVPPALCSMPYGPASTANRYVTPSGASPRGRCELQPSGHGTTETQVTTSAPAASADAVQRSARHGEQFDCNRAEPMPELAR
jgi:hypothetical protein